MGADWTYGEAFFLFKKKSAPTTAAIATTAIGIIIWFMGDDAPLPTSIGVIELTVRVAAGLVEPK